MVGRIVLSLTILLSVSLPALAQEPPVPPVAGEGEKGEVETILDQIRNSDKPENITSTVEILFLLTILTLAPSILVMMTCFTRIVVVLAFLRQALGAHQLPPSQIIIGLSLLLTFMVMAPTFQGIHQDAIVPYTSEDPTAQITQKEAFSIAEAHFREFMFTHVREDDVYLFMQVTKQGPGSGKDENGVPNGLWMRKDVPTLVLIPAFVISELRRAFIMGFALFLPFLVIDMVVASTLISMGMLVLPPILISLPFKILLFVLVDGWHLVVGSLVESFYT